MTEQQNKGVRNREESLHILRTVPAILNREAVKNPVKGTPDKENYGALSPKDSWAALGGGPQNGSPAGEPWTPRSSSQPAPLSEEPFARDDCRQMSVNDVGATLAVARSQASLTGESSAGNNYGATVDSSGFSGTSGSFAKSDAHIELERLKPVLEEATQLQGERDRYISGAMRDPARASSAHDEVQTLRHSMEWIEQELAHPIDKFSKELIVTNLELIMDYCLRFYERQFITRKALNVSTLERFSELLSEYLLQGEAATHGVPTVRYFAQRIHLSPNYLGDLVKTETGYSAQEFIAQRLVQYAERQLQDEQLSVKEIALQAGFRHPQHFVRFFKKHTSLTPTDFRAQTSTR